MKHPTPGLPAGPRQLSMALDSLKLRGMSPGQRAAAVAALANLLREAARAAEEAHDDDRL